MQNDKKSGKTTSGSSISHNIRQERMRTGNVERRSVIPTNSTNVPMPDVKPPKEKE